MSGLRVLVIVACAACFTKPGRPPEGNDGGTTGGDATDAFVPRQQCPAFPTQQVTPLPGVTSGVAGDPTMTEDKLEVLFVFETGTSYDIWAGSRTTTTGTFSVVMAQLPFCDNANDEADPALTADGKLMAYVRNNQVGRFVTRTNTVWNGTHTVIPGLDNAQMHSINLSPNGLVIYYEYDGTLRSARRTNLGQAFVEDLFTLGGGMSFPTVSSDGLEIFYIGPPGGHIWRATRASTSAAFDAGSDTGIQGADPDLSADGETLVVATGVGAGFVTRDCQ